MTYIIREQDGEHFVIPSYRDVLTITNKNELKKDILALSQSYGDYITLQKKSPLQYEVAFSPETGYLLGESIWHYFKSPLDMVYCESLPNTNQAILVIVKDGSVYLDGSFPLDAIPEELVIFLTQESHFEIFIHGDVPIAKEAENGKFNFDEKSVRSFSVLEKPVFPTLPLLKIYRLQLVEPVLKANGIGVFPVKQIIIGVVVLGLLWMAYSYLTAPKPEVVTAQPQVNPYQGYNAALTSPAPNDEVQAFLPKLQLLLALPAWAVDSVTYSQGKLTATTHAAGGKIQTLLDYSDKNDINVTLNPKNVTLSMFIKLPNRPRPSSIYPIKEVLTTLIDRMTTYINGTTTRLQLSDFKKEGSYTTVTITLNFNEMSPDMLLLLTAQLKDLPVVLRSITLNTANGIFSGTVIFDVLGNE